LKNGVNANRAEFDVTNAKGCIYPTSIPNFTYPEKSEIGNQFSEQNSLSPEFKIFFRMVKS